MMITEADMTQTTRVARNRHLTWLALAVAALAIAALLIPTEAG